MSEWVRLVVGLLLLLIVGVAVARWAGLETTRGQVVAVLRAVLQLGIVAAALRGVFAAPLFAIAVVAVMFAVATWTSSRRLAGTPGAPRAVVLSCATGSGVAIAVLVGLPALDRDVRTLVAVSGIILGGTMTAATLTGRHLREQLVRRHEEVEAWLSLGATPRQAVADVARRAAREALVPNLDQTRTTGLVTLPGAFVGALLGGVSPLGAARFQVAVLVGLLCAQTITAVLVAHQLGAPEVIPVEPVR